MRRVKWMFFAYLAVVAAIGGTILASVWMVPGRDPDTLYTIYVSNIPSLDPALISDTASNAVAGNIFETLFDYDYKAKPYKLIPEIAAGMPQISPDGLNWTIHLKKGIHYYDPTKKVFPGGTGPEITANDFIYAWKRVADFHLASQNYSAVFEDRIVGLDDWWEYTRNTPREKIDWDRPVAGFAASDPYTLVIRLTRPYPQLLYNLAHLPTAAVCRAAVEKLGALFQFTPIGSGPYMMTEYEPEQRIILQANPIYRGNPQAIPGRPWPADMRLPHARRVQMDYFQEDLPAWALFQQRLVDMSGIPRDTFGTAIQMGTGKLTPQMQARGIHLSKEPDPTIWYLGFNMQDPLVGGNKPLREAMSMAFNRKRFIDLMLNGRGIAMKSIFPPGFEAYDPNFKNPDAEFNLEAARQKMREAERINHGPIPPVTLLMGGTDTFSRQYAEVVQQMMGQIGVRVKLEFATWARFQEMIDSRQAQFFSSGWQADYPDEQTFLQLFYSKNAAPGPNSANYSNPEFDRLYEKAITMNPGPQRLELYRRLEKIALSDTPWIVMMSTVVYDLYYDWIGNVTANTYIHSRLPYYTLNVALRKKEWRKAD